MNSKITIVKAQATDIPKILYLVKKLADFERFKGERASVKLRMPLDARKNFLGTIDGTEKDTVLLMCEGELYRFALSNIDKARLSPEFKR